MMHSLKTRMTLWFALSALGVTLVFAVVTYFHLRHELRVERWERSHPNRPDFALHGSYTEDEVNDIASELLRLSLAYSGLVAILAIGLGVALARRSLRPISSINAQLQDIGIQTLDRRLSAPEADTELQTITANINELLERIEGSYREMSEFSARVAHELKTPMTLLRLQLEDAAERIEPTLAESLQDELLRIEGFVEQCLLLARAEHGQIRGESERIDIKPFLDDLLEPFTLMARDAKREIQVACSPNAVARSIPWILRQILSNLIGNALRHGEGPIAIAVESRDEAVEISIRNPIAAKANPGTGLGLRIARALATAHANLQLTTAAEGAAFVARVRLAHASKTR